MYFSLFQISKRLIFRDFFYYNLVQLEGINTSTFYQHSQTFVIFVTCFLVHTCKLATSSCPQMSFSTLLHALKTSSLSLKGNLIRLLFLLSGKVTAQNEFTYVLWAMTKSNLVSTNDALSVSICPVFTFNSICLMFSSRTHYF